jgi:hypothetical protein
MATVPATKPKSTNTSYVFALELLGLASNGGIKGLAPGNYNTPGNQSLIEKWVAREGGGGLNNPLNTTLRQPGSTPLKGNSAGVQNYTSFIQGVDATALTIGNGFYPDIVAALGTGNANAIDASGGLAHGLSKWSNNAYITVQGVTATPDKVLGSGPGPDAGVVVPEFVPGVDMSSVPGFLGGSGANLPTGVFGDFEKWFGTVFPKVLKIGLGILLILIGVLILVNGEKSNILKAAE